MTIGQNLTCCKSYSRAAPILTPDVRDDDAASSALGTDQIHPQLPHQYSIDCFCMLVKIRLSDDYWQKFVSLSRSWVSVKQYLVVTKSTSLSLWLITNNEWGVAGGSFCQAVSLPYLLAFAFSRNLWFCGGVESLQAVSRPCQIRWTARPPD